MIAASGCALSPLFRSRIISTNKNPGNVAFNFEVSSVCM